MKSTLCRTYFKCIRRDLDSTLALGLTLLDARVFKETLIIIFFFFFNIGRDGRDGRDGPAGPPGSPGTPGLGTNERFVNVEIVSLPCEHVI